MSMIWGTNADGAWHPLRPSPYPAEQALHDLVELAPRMLPLSGSPRITILGREVQLGSGYADLIAVESSGRPVVIEVKLAGNSESRRAVVAQVLSYAAYLQGLDSVQLESEVLSSHLTKLGVQSILGAVEADDQEHIVDPEAFDRALNERRADGSFRLVIVLDDAPDDLVQIIGYLESVSDKIVIDLITVSAYEVDGSQILVPQRIEPARRLGELSDAEAIARQANAPRPGSTDFRKVIAETPEPQHSLLIRLVEWAEMLQHEALVRLSTYHGKSGRTTLLPRLASGSGLATIYRDIKSSYLQFWRSAFERYAPNSIERIERALGSKLKQGNVTHDVSEELLDALTDAYREANGIGAK